MLRSVIGPQSCFIWQTENFKYQAKNLVTAIANSSYTIFQKKKIPTWSIIYLKQEQSSHPRWGSIIWKNLQPQQLKTELIREHLTNKSKKSTRDNLSVKIWKLFAKLCFGTVQELHISLMNILNRTSQNDFSFLYNIRLYIFDWLILSLLENYDK